MAEQKYGTAEIACSGYWTTSRIRQAGRASEPQVRPRDLDLLSHNDSRALAALPAESRPE